MKYIILLLLLASTSYADDIEQKITIGAGPYFQTQPYGGVDAQMIASPIIFFDNELFYVRWTRVGAYFLGNKNDDFSWAFSLTIQPRVYGYEASDIQGMNERENTWEGGLAFSMKKGDTYIEVMALHDLLNKYNSWILKTEIGHDVKVGNFSIYPSINAEYQAEGFVNYYFGVTQNEAITRSETQYISKAGLQIGIQTFIDHPITNKLSALINLKADRLPSSASKSTIVEDKYIYSGLASLIYTFNY